MENYPVHIQLDDRTGDTVVTNPDWVLKQPSFDETDSMLETSDSWAASHSKYQRSFGVPPAGSVSDRSNTEKCGGASSHIEDQSRRLRLANPADSQDHSLLKLRLSRSPLDNLQAEFRRYGKLNSHGKLELNRQYGPEDEATYALDAPDWGFVQRKFELPENPKVDDCPSMTTGSTISSRNSSTRSTKSGKWNENNQQDKDICPSPERGCGLKEVFAQPLRHQAEQPEKCPIETCEYHTKGFAKPYEKVRHALTHFKRSFICDFCPSTETITDRTFLRCDVFLRHLVSAHGVSPVPRARRAELYRTSIIKQQRIRLGNQAVATCTLCSEPFDAQGFYEHLRGCVLRQVTKTHSRLHIFSDALSVSSHMEEPKRFHESVVANPTDSSSIVSRQIRESHIEYLTSNALSPVESSTDCIKTDSQDMDIAELTASSRCLSLTSSRGDGDAMKSSSEEETDWTDDISSPDSASDAEEVRPMLSPMKRHLVDSVMVEFHKIFDKFLRTNNGADSNHSTTTGSGVGSYNGSSGSSIYSSSSFISRKRSLSGGSTPPPNDNGDDPHKRRRPEPKADNKQPLPELRFACPYYKRNPGRHQTFTSCRDPGFVTVARLKEHLYRRHLLPIQCNRCCSTFSNEPRLREHQRDPRGCEVKEHLPLEGFDKDQERNLKSKKRSLVYLSEEDKWKSVYRILFPDDNEADMPSPYIEYYACNGQNGEPSNIARFQEFSRLEMPRLVRRTLEVAVEEEAQPLEDKLKERLVDIVRECQSQLISMFQSTQTQMIDTSELTPALLPPAGPAATQGIQIQGTQAGTTFQNFDSFALVAPSPDFISIPVTQYTGCGPHQQHEQHKKEATDSPDSGYDSTWTAGPSLSHQHQEPLPSFQLDGSSFNPSSVYPQQAAGIFMQEPGFAGSDFVDLEGYYGLFETQTQAQTQARDVGFISEVADPAWRYLDPTTRDSHNSVTGPGYR